MTDANFEPSQTVNKLVIAKVAKWEKWAVSLNRFLLRILPAKRPLDAGAILAAQARSETARRSVNNLLR